MKKILLGMLLLAYGSANAQKNAPLPYYDVKASCSEIARTGGTPSQFVMQGCLQNEQNAYNNLKATWASIPAEIKKTCDEVSRTGGNATYYVLLGCIQNEQASAANNQSFQFKR